MRILLLLLSLALTYPFPHHAQPPATTKPSPTPVGTIYGKPITAADIALTAPVDITVKFDARDSARWELMGRILTAFGKPVLDRFVQDQRLDATPDEIKAFQDATRKAIQQNTARMEKRLETIQSDLASPTLSEQERSKLEKERATLERVLPTQREAAKDAATRNDPARIAASEAMARQFIIAWKTERELHRTFGGRIIFQQAGPEALDARRRLYEQAEKSGDLNFTDPGVRHLFYYYYANMRHNVMNDNTVFERPWWLMDEPTQTK